MQYFDIELAPGAAHRHAVPPAHSTVFAYVHSGEGTLAGAPVKRGSVAKLDAAAGPVACEGGGAGGLGLLLLTGAPLGEPVVQHGPFVMASSAQIKQTFADYQSGKFLPETCRYVRHTAAGSEETTRSLR